MYTYFVCSISLDSDTLHDHLGCGKVDIVALHGSGTRGAGMYYLKKKLVMLRSENGRV
jgi:hypothetical protein